MKNLVAFRQQLQTAAKFFKRHFDKNEAVTIVHHNDADGLSSALIIKHAIERLGGTVYCIALEKPYPAAVARIQSTQATGIIMYVDFAGRSAQDIVDHNGNQRPILILDHHLPTVIADEWVMNVNPMFFGLAGDRDLSAAGVAYLFACQLADGNSDLAFLAVIGAVGDGQDHGEAFSGLNAQFIATAVEQGVLRLGPSRDVRTGTIPVLGEASLGILSSDATTLGAVGYLEGGVEEGLRLLQQGYSDASHAALSRLRQMQTKLFATMEEKLHNGALQRTEHIQSFDAAGDFHPMGVKMVGVFCSSLRDKEWIDPNKYIAGFQWIPEEVPGLGRIPFAASKVSMRIPQRLEERMFAGEVPSLLEFLPQATERLGGFVDGCHSYSAATTIGQGLETKLVAEMEQILTEQE